MLPVFHNQAKKDRPVPPGCKSQHQDCKLYKVTRNELWELKQQRVREHGNRRIIFCSDVKTRHILFPTAITEYQRAATYWNKSETSNCKGKQV